MDLFTQQMYTYYMEKASFHSDNRKAFSFISTYYAG